MLRAALDHSAERLTAEQAGIDEAMPQLDGVLTEQGLMVSLPIDYDIVVHGH
jgi:hypothetical protein